VESLCCGKKQSAMENKINIFLRLKEVSTNCQQNNNAILKVRNLWHLDSTNIWANK